VFQQWTEESKGTEQYGNPDENVLSMERSLVASKHKISLFFGKNIYIREYLNFVSKLSIMLNFSPIGSGFELL
jgi:hypothetical protein